MAIFQPKVKPQLQKEKPHLPRTEFKCTHANRTHVKRTQAFRLTPPPMQQHQQRSALREIGTQHLVAVGNLGKETVGEKVQFKFNLQPTMSLQKEHEGHKARSEHSAHFQQNVLLPAKPQPNHR